MNDQLGRGMKESKFEEHKQLSMMSIL